VRNEDTRLAILTLFTSTASYAVVHYDLPSHSTQRDLSAASCLRTCSTTGPVMRKTDSLFLLLFPVKFAEPVYSTLRSITRALQW
jgi:hypothetical protein